MAAELFTEGDRVLLSTSSWWFTVDWPDIESHSPLGVVGTVSYVDGLDEIYHVQWDNGMVGDGYTDTCLVPATTVSSLD